jgi:hypothetical protein
MAEKTELTKVQIKKIGTAISWLLYSLLSFIFIPFLSAGCSTGPPPLLAPVSKTLRFQVTVQGGITTSFTENGTQYLGVYRIAVNDLNTSLIGSDTLVTTNPDTWTDYFELDNSGWIRNDRIASPTSQQPQQWTGPQAITPGSITSNGNSLIIVLKLPDTYLGNAQQFDINVFTYIVPASSSLVNCLNPQNQCIPPVISEIGAALPTTPPLINFNENISNPYTINNQPNDYLEDPVDLPGLTTSDYENFALSSLTVSIQ